MGSILNRSILVSIITYAGVVIGYVNVLWLYPAVLEAEQIGLLRAVQDIAVLFVPFAQLGAGQGLIRYFPSGTTKEEQQQILSLSLLWSLFSFLLFLILFWLLQDWIYQFFAEKAQAVNEFLPVVLLLTFILTLQAVLEPLSRSILKFRFVAFSREILLRLLSAVLILLYFFHYISFGETVWGLIIIYGVVTAAIAVSLLKTGFLNIRFSQTPQVRRLVAPFMRYGLITFLSSASAMLVMKTDTLMITQMLGLTATGIYTTVFYIAVLVEMPRRILSQISTPLLSQAFEKNNMPLAEKIYQKSALNLLLVGGLLYVGVICNMGALFELMPDGQTFQTGAMVVVLIGIGKLIDGAAGVNGEILAMSAYYRINLYFTLLMAALNVVLNYLFIPLWGIEGAAIASCLSLLAFNFLKYLYIKLKLQLQPFSLNYLYLLLVLAAAFCAGWYMPQLSSLFADMVLRSLVITLLVAGGVLGFNLSEEATSLFNKGLRQLRIRQ